MGAIISELNHVLHKKGFVSDDDLRAISERLNVPLYRLEGIVSFYPHFRRSKPPRAEISLCRDVSCRLAGGRDFLARARQALSGIPDIEVREVSCLGRCDSAPAASVNEHPLCAASLDRLVSLAKSPPDRHAPQEPAPSGRAWKSNPYENSDQYYRIFSNLKADQNSSELIINTLKASGLRGMGGAGFPTGLKWELVRKESSAVKYIVCNADESEPGTFKDRLILSELPHLVVEGMAMAALAVGAAEGIVFIRHEYAAERTAIARAIEDARARGVLGADARGPGLAFDISIFVSPGGYILGEETALLECLEDKRGEPRNKPPFPGQKGLWEKPTLINNVETFSYVPMIVERGADAWKQMGVRSCAGLKFIALSGDVVHPGVYQVPMGTTIGELIELAGGVAGGKNIYAIAPGGASSNFLRADAVDAPLDFKALQERGSMLGSGAVLVVAEGADLVDLAANIVQFFRNESCGKCVPCRVGSEKAVVMLDKAVEGKGEQRHLELFPELAETMADTSICGLGQVALAPFLSVLKVFGDEVRARFPET